MTDPIEWHEEVRSINELNAYEKNPRHVSRTAFAKLKESIAQLGYHAPIAVQPDGTLISGHQRYRALLDLGHTDVRVIVPSRTLEEAEFKQMLIQSNLNAGAFDFDMLAADFEVSDLVEWGMPAEWLIGEPEPEEKNHGALAERFGVPPFSILDAKAGWWQDRKRAWLSMGIKSEVGRDAALLGSGGSGNSPEQAKALAKKYGKDEAALANGGVGVYEEATSVFDPVLCELAYKWFCPPSGVVLDPFAGGSVRGVVAANLGLSYIGVELRAEQVAANREQAKQMELNCAWIEGDSMDIVKLAKGVQADLLFTCPPYADLEVYSDDERDLSNMAYPQFKETYMAIIAEAAKLLKPDSFACVVVGEVRNPVGNYYNFVGDTVQAFMGAGLNYYNEAILLTAIGSLPVRAGKPFKASRKLAKAHQNVLVFVKGDAKKATAKLADPEFGELGEV